MLVCVFKIFSETTGPTVAKFHVEPQWDRGGKFIQIIPVICCSSFEYCQPLGAGAFRRAFTTNVVPQCRAFSWALEIEKLKAPLFRGPDWAGDTNDWCISQTDVWESVCIVGEGGLHLFLSKRVLSFYGQIVIPLV